MTTRTRKGRKQSKAAENNARETVAGWSQGQKRCRGRRFHTWNPLTVIEHPGHYEVIEQCPHCKNRRTADYVETTWGLRRATKWKTAYKSGYLLTKGSKITEDIADELVASDILSRRIVKAGEDD